MSLTAETFWIIAVLLALFGAVFAFLGMSSERAYWSQRDPSGDPRKEATKFHLVVIKALHYATGDYRAPLRIAAIGVILWYLAIIFVVLALITTA